MRTQYHQIYAESSNLFDFFDLDKITKKQYIPLKISDFYGWIFGAIGNLKREIKEFRDDGKQYIFLLEGDIEVKIAGYPAFNTPYSSKFWMHVSAKRLEDAMDVFDYIVLAVQEKVKELVKDPS
ncbi:MAG: hypothetical protein H0Z28_04420 [Archaeoglobus sp.]|nr:hypothetical protein [Archaeoglobus sp.]